MWEFLKLIPSGLAVIGQGISAWSAHDTKKLDVSLEKYKVDGVVDQSLINADVKVAQANMDLEKAALAYRGERFLRYFFGYTTGVYYAAQVVDSVLQRVFGWQYDVLALPPQAASWAGWIVAGLFGHSMLTTWTRK